MMRRVFVHCGLAKTGTTSLQNYLALCAAELGSLGFEYPRIGFDPVANAQHNLALDLLGRRRFDPALGTIADFLAFLRRTELGPDIVISSEAFSPCLGKMNARERFYDFLREIGKISELHIVFSFRTFWRRLDSGYLERLKTGKPNAPIPDQVRASRLWHRNFFGRMTALSEIASRVTALDVECTFPDSISAMLATLGIEESLLPQHRRILNVRPSLKKSAYLYRRQYGPGGQFLGRPRKEIGAISHAIGNMPDLPGDETHYSVLSLDEANEVQAGVRSLIPPLFADRLCRLVEPEVMPLRHVNLADVELTKEDLEKFGETMRNLHLDRPPPL
jgi:hypothetical protein